MAKTRAQRKAERRRREAKQRQDAQQQGREESHAQHDTQAPISGDVAEAEAIMRTGASPEDYGEHTTERDHGAAPTGSSPVPGVLGDSPQPEPVVEPPEAPAPSRADVGAPAEAAPPADAGEDRRARREREKEQRRKARAKQLSKGQTPGTETTERKRGAVTGFIASCWAELKKVQWPDRDTLVQASAVTVLFVAICAVYLGALDAAFNWLIKQIL
ncbi:MAG: preprotein translocase subunit SecE [Solirubrobacterales bacterium]|nr:preprotein translocase subunit SecE [Solirubrobacterales bacterium]